MTKTRVLFERSTTHVGWGESSNQKGGILQDMLGDLQDEQLLSPFHRFLTHLNQSIFCFARREVFNGCHGLVGVFLSECTSLLDTITLGDQFTSLEDYHCQRMGPTSSTEKKKT